AFLYVLVCFSFFLYCAGAHRDLHSFPTRRSSDLQDGGGGVDGHRGGDAVERDALEQVLHVLERGDRDPHLADFAALEDMQDLFRSEEHTSELQSRSDLVCRLLLEKKNNAR